jgi:hypothetical protein
MINADNLGFAIQKIESSNFAKLKLNERESVIDWISKHPICFYEYLLVIQKNFYYSNNDDCLDLLAIDKLGNLLIIITKSENAEQNITWRAMKCASYFSTINTKQILGIFSQYLNKIGSLENAEEIIKEFLEIKASPRKLNKKNSQRILIVEGEFEKETIKSVEWLLNYGLRIKCFKSIPYKLDDKIYLNMEQVIPKYEYEEFISTKDA